MEILVTVLCIIIAFLSFRLFTNTSFDKLDEQHVKDKIVHQERIKEIDKVIKDLEDKPIVIIKRPTDLTSDAKVSLWEERLAKIATKKEEQ